MSATPWEIGIIHPIHNSSFRLRKIAEWTINGNHAASSATITVNQLSNNPTAQYFSGVNGDNFMISNLYKVVLGPSSNSNDINSTEEILINNVSGNVITLMSNTSYAYVSGDSCTIYGTGMPDGWTSGSDFLTTSLLKGQYAGRDDLCSFGIAAMSSDADDKYAQLRIPKLLPNMVYSLGLSYIAPGSTSSSLEFHVYENSLTTPVLKKNVTLTYGTASWTESQTTFTSGSSQDSNGKIEVGLNYTGPGTDNTPETQIDCVSLQFMWPNVDSSRGTQRLKTPENISVIDLTDRPINTLLTGYKKIVPSPIQLLERKRFAIRCNFTLATGYATSSVYGSYDTLSHILAWQEMGYLLGLRTGIEELPPVLTGRLKLDGISAENSDTTKRNFGFVFEEVPV